MKRLFLTILAVSYTVFSDACGKCDEVYSYVMQEQYRISAILYDSEDVTLNLILKSKLGTLSRIREILEDKL